MSVTPIFNDRKSPRDTLHPCVCTDRTEETNDVFTLVFERIDGLAFKFLAGQFVTVRFSWNDERFSRVFTIASAPTRPQRIALTIKAAADGKATRILHDHFDEGSTAEISEAGGEFTLEGRAVEKTLFLCAGSGITPLMSMVRMLHDAGKELDISFVQCARTQPDILFEDELQMLSRTIPSLRVKTVCSQASTFDRDSPTGRLDVAQLARLVPDAPERTAFLCGPAGFMDAMRRHLLELGLAGDRIFEEAFGPRPTPANNVCADDKAIIFFARSGIHVEADENATLLDCAEAAGVNIETSCRMGVCGTCRVRLTKGEVDMNDMGGLSDTDREDSFILSCCSRPKGDITIDL